MPERKSVSDLIAQANSSFPDNAIGAITPALLRGWLLDMLDTFRPAYALMSVTGTVQQLGTTPSIVVMATALDSRPSETTTAIPASTITRAFRGTSKINVDCDIEAPNGRFITFTLYKNGVALQGDVTVNGGGAGNPVAGSFTWADYADPAGVYDIRATCETDATNVTFNNVSVLLSVEPVNSYT